jgi:hypothetical protein
MNRPWYSYIYGDIFTRSALNCKGGRMEWGDIRDGWRGRELDIILSYGTIKA